MGESRNGATAPLELPAPVPARETPRPASGARVRTLQHLHAFLGSAAAASAACGPDHRRAPPNTDDFGPPRDPVTASSKTTTTSSTPRPQPPPSGYMVVDMMPAPARCATNAASKITATRAVFADSPVTAVIHLSPVPDGLTEPDFTRINGAPVVGSPRARFVAGGLEIRATPTPGAHSLSVSVPVRCSAGTGLDDVGTVRVQLSWSGDAAPGVTPAVSVTGVRSSR